METRTTGSSPSLTFRPFRRATCFTVCIFFQKKTARLRSGITSLLRRVGVEMADAPCLRSPSRACRRPPRGALGASTVSRGPAAPSADCAADSRVTCASVQRLTNGHSKPLLLLFKKNRNIDYYVLVV